MNYKGFSIEPFRTLGAMISPPGFRWDPLMCCINQDGTLNKDRFKAHLVESKTMIAEIMGMGIMDFQMSMRLWPFLLDDREFKVTPEISPWAWKDGKFDLLTFNETYFRNIGEMVHIACGLGVYLYLIIFDNCHMDGLPNSPLRLNSNGVQGIYDLSPIAIHVKELWIRKLLDSAIYYTEKQGTQPQPIICPLGYSCPKNSEISEVPGKTEQICGVEICNEPNDSRFPEVAVQVMTILQDPAYLKLITPFRTILGPRAIMPGDTNEQRLFRDTSCRLGQASLRGPGVSGSMLWKVFHNFGELYRNEYLINTLGRASGSDGCMFSGDGDYPKLTAAEWEKKLGWFLDQRSPGHNRAYQGRYFAFEALVDGREDWDSIKGIMRAFKNNIDRAGY